MKKMNTDSNPLQTLEQSLDTDFFKILSEPARVELIKHLLRMPNSDIGTIAKQMSQDRSVVSRHLKAMLKAGLVTCQKEGKYSYYCLNGPEFVEKLENILSIVKEAITTDCC